MKFGLPPLIVRADANPYIGTGHIMRCLALAQAWQARGGEAAFVTACNSDGLRQRLSNEGFELTLLERQYPDPADWALTSKVLAAHPGAWVALDGYHFYPSYQLHIKNVHHPLLVIDDTANLDHYYADVLLNQNIHAGQLDYSCEPYTRLLLGTRYALLRREFWAWRGWQREIPEVARKVLVTLGGGDYDKVTLKVMKALQRVDVDELEVMVVVGATNPHFHELALAALISRFVVRIVRDTTNMPELMAWADVSVSAGGITSWEMAFMGLPGLVIALADNQRLVAESLEAEGAAKSLGWHEDFASDEVSKILSELLKDPDKREDMARMCRKLVDGRGVDRITRLLGNNEIRLRPVREDDCQLLWEWANDPDVRAASFSTELITWEQHIKWFKLKIEDPDCLILIAMDSKGSPIGQARFERKGDEAQISISVGKEFRDRGYGSHIIELASKKVFEVLGIHKIDCYIKIGNKLSQSAFRNAGYKEIGLKTIKGHPAIHLTLTK
jgi:UDP-2,4-diacetamido-2,4,6-trideoxy-beta-L-altropyranose hydrolase